MNTKYLNVLTISINSRSINIEPLSDSARNCQAFFLRLVKLFLFVKSSFFFEIDELFDKYSVNTRPAKTGVSSHSVPSCLSSYLSNNTMTDSQSVVTPSISSALLVLPQLLLASILPQELIYKHQRYHHIEHPLSK